MSRECRWIQLVAALAVAGLYPKILHRAGSYSRLRLWCEVLAASPARDQTNQSRIGKDDLCTQCYGSSDL